MSTSSYLLSLFPRHKSSLPHYHPRLFCLFLNHFHTTAYYFTHYDTLETHPHADHKVIKSQYYKLSKKYHPDMNPRDIDAQAKFLRVKEAYSILGNRYSRKEYDSSLSGRRGHKRERGHSEEFAGSRYYGPGPGSQSAGAMAWRQSRMRPRQGSGTTSKTAEAARKAGSPFTAHQRVQYNLREHYERHYAQSEKSRFARKDNGEPTGNEVMKEEESSLVRFLKIGTLFVGIMIFSGWVGSGGKGHVNLDGVTTEKEVKLVEVGILKRKRDRTIDNIGN